MRTVFLECNECVSQNSKRKLKPAHLNSQSVKRLPVAFETTYARNKVCVLMDNDKSTRNIWQLCSGLSEEQRKMLENASVSAVQQAANCLSSTDYITRSLCSSMSAINEIIKQSISNYALESLKIAASMEEIQRIMRDQISAIGIMERSTSTLMMESLRHALLNANYASMYDIAARTLRSSLIEVADISFFKMSDLGLSLLKDPPRGLRTAINSLNVEAATRLAQCDDISYEVYTRKFIVEEKPDSKASAKELNIICSGANILEGSSECDEVFTEAELIDFLTILDDTPTFASDTETGRKIVRLIQSVGNTIGFDREIFYHSRIRSNDACPYTFSEMLAAPRGVTGPGRYNHPGRAYYYFADSKAGSENEIMKHYSDGVIQTAAIRPIRDIQMLDLSGTMRGGRTFLRYVRFPATNLDNRMPREYLLPCFVSDCCRRIGIEGIKYYGSKDYSNYVCWNDGYFSYDHME